YFPLPVSRDSRSSHHFGDGVIQQDEQPLTEGGRLYGIYDDYSDCCRGTGRNHLGGSDSASPQSGQVINSLQVPPLPRAGERRSLESQWWPRRMRAFDATFVTS